MYHEKTLVCKLCRQPFLFTAEEQELFERRGYLPPSICKDCRRDQRYGGRTYPAVCAACGRNAKVPFPPPPDKLVYCADCWSQIVAEKKARRKKRSS